MNKISGKIIKREKSIAYELLVGGLISIFVYDDIIIIMANNLLYNVHIADIVDMDWKKYGITTIKFNIKLINIICEQFYDAWGNVYPRKDELARQRFINEFKSCEFV